MAGLRQPNLLEMMVGPRQLSLLDQAKAAPGKADAFLRQFLGDRAEDRSKRVQREDLVDLRNRYFQGGDAAESLAKELASSLPDEAMSAADYQALLQAPRYTTTRSTVGQAFRKKAGLTAEQDIMRRLYGAAAEDSMQGMAIRGAGVTAGTAGVALGLTATGQGLLALTDYISKSLQTEQEREQPLPS